MNAAQRFVQAIHARFKGRVPLRVGLAFDASDIYPVVFEDATGTPMGLLGCAWNGGADDTLVQLYHLSAFTPRRGAGTFMMTYLCSLADEYGVRICVQAEPRWINDDEPLDKSALNAWYRRFGFKGAGALRREPRAPSPYRQSDLRT